MEEFLYRFVGFSKAYDVSIFLYFFHQSSGIFIKGPKAEELKNSNVFDSKTRHFLINFEDFSQGLKTWVFEPISKLLLGPSAWNFIYNISGFFKAQRRGFLKPFSSPKGVGILEGFFSHKGEGILNRFLVLKARAF